MTWTLEVTQDEVLLPRKSLVNLQQQMLQQAMILAETADRQGLHLKQLEQHEFGIRLVFSSSQEPSTQED